MSATAWGILGAVVVLGFLAGLPLGLAWLRRRRRSELMRRPFPGPWDALLRKDFPRYGQLPPDVARKLRGLVLVFLAEKRFEACGGLPGVTDEMKVLIAAQACLLQVGRKRNDWYRDLRSILVYPGAFRDHGQRIFDLRRHEDDGVRLGESWETGSVILSWENVTAGARNSDDGMNVVFHEFAHQLDHVGGVTDGVPILKDRGDYRNWATVFQREYDRLVEEADDPGTDPLLDPYGATNPAEFFAVATETFFEQSEDMRLEHPELYEALREFYGLDPAGWR